MLEHEIEKSQSVNRRQLALQELRSQDILSVTGTYTDLEDVEVPEFKLGHDRTLTIDEENELLNKVVHRQVDPDTGEIEEIPLFSIIVDDVFVHNRNLRFGEKIDEGDLGFGGEFDWNIETDVCVLTHHLPISSHETRKVVSSLEEIEIDGANWRKITLEKLILHGVRSVIFRYSGSCDDGEIESIALEPKHTGDKEFLASSSVRRVNPGSGKSEDIPLDLMLKEIAWVALTADFRGFEINEGGSGQILWDIQADRIEIEHRYNSSSWRTVIVTF